MIWQPTMAAVCLWDRLTFPSPSTLEVDMLSDISIRKDKKGVAKRITHSVRPAGAVAPELTAGPGGSIAVMPGSRARMSDTSTRPIPPCCTHSPLSSGYSARCRPPQPARTCLSATPLPLLEVWQIPSEIYRQLGTAAMNQWLVVAPGRTSMVLHHDFLANDHRHGAGTLAYRFLKTLPETCFIADWEATAGSFMRTYYRPNLVVYMAIAKFFFNDLAR